MTIGFGELDQICLYDHEAAWSFGETKVVQHASTLHVACPDLGIFLTIRTITNYLTKLLQKSQKPKKSISKYSALRSNTTLF